jgi:hypothetical protein
MGLVSEIWFLSEVEVFLEATVSRQAVGATHSPVQLVLGPFPRVIQLCHLADYQSLNIVVKNVCSCNCSPPHVFMAWCWIKHRGKVNFNVQNLQVCLQAWPVSGGGDLPQAPLCRGLQPITFLCLICIIICTRGSHILQLAYQYMLFNTINVPPVFILCI